VAEGTPETVSQEARSYTGRYLKPLLEGKHAEVVAAPPKKKRASAATRQREAAE
jgi:excinuclease ABC subunit A